MQMTKMNTFQNRVTIHQRAENQITLNKETPTALTTTQCRLPQWAVIRNTLPMIGHGSTIVHAVATATTAIIPKPQVDSSITMVEMTTENTTITKDGTIIAARTTKPTTGQAT